jgi:predicted small integral membrane protein
VGDLCDTVSPPASWEPDMVIRIAKIVIVAVIAALMSLVAFDNVTDYGTNFVFVQHVLSMDTVFPAATTTYRAITSPELHHAAYVSIIAAQAITAVLCWAGTALLLRRLHGSAVAFNRAKALGIAGLTLGFVIYAFGFITIGGEWFGMWMSHEWNGQESAFRFAILNLGVLLLLAVPDADIRGENSNLIS